LLSGASVREGGSTFCLRKVRRRLLAVT